MHVDAGSQLYQHTSLKSSVLSGWYGPGGRRAPRRGRRPGRWRASYACKHGTPVSGWSKQLVSRIRIGVPNWSLGSHMSAGAAVLCMWPARKSNTVGTCPPLPGSPAPENDPRIGMSSQDQKDVKTASMVDS